MPIKPPLPPHLNEQAELHTPKHPGPHPHDIPPHEKKRKFWSKRLALSIIVGCGVTSILALILWLFNIPINTILPVAAPVWAGVTTLTYTAIGDKIAP